METFHFGECHGLMEQSADSLRIIAIVNEVSGNGDFSALMSKLEEIADEMQVPLEIVHLWNNGLAACLKRRGYEIRDSALLGKHAHRKIPVGSPGTRS